MPPMRFGDLQDNGRQRLHPKPLWNLVPQNTLPNRNWAIFRARTALSGHDDDKSLSLRMGFHHKPGQRRMRRVERHSMQVQLPFGS